jgi:selenocysteine-specific elongation factor
LVKALTGIDPDRLEEEKRRGITIDIGFAHLELGLYRLGFVDVPGHERFVRNMLAGIGGIDLVLLIVAANESVMPQTVEHFQICRLLDVKHGLVVITKSDQVDAELLELVREEVGELVQGSFLAGAPIVAVDNLSGAGLDELRTTLLDQVLPGIDTNRGQALERAFRLPVDRVFTIRGFGTVVTGTPVSGRLSRDEAVTIHPSGRTAKVRGIQVFNQAQDSAAVGQRTALNVVGVDKQDLERGMVLARAGSFQPSHMFDVALRLLPGCARPLRHRRPVRFHHGAAELVGRCYLLDREELAPGQAAVAQVRLDRPTVCCPGDRFVLRSYSPATTIGGGLVLDNAPPKHRRADSARVTAELSELGKRWEQDSPDLGPALVEYFVCSNGPLGLDVQQLAWRTGWLESGVKRALSAIPTVELIPQEPSLAVSRQAASALREEIVDYLSRFRKSNPMATGAPKEEVKARIMPWASPAYFQFMLDSLVRERKIELNAGEAAVFGAQVELSPLSSDIRTRIVALLEKSGMQPPGWEEITAALPYPAKEIREVYHFLLKRGELVRVAADIVLLARQAEALKQRVRALFVPGRAFSVSEFKDAFSLSRKYAIPFLEYLDRERVTRRTGDQRVVL